MSEKMNEKVEEVVKKSFAREALEWIICFAVAFALALFIKYFVFTPTLVMQESMTPTILNGERVFVNRLVRTFKSELRRGDIVTFEAPSFIKLGEGVVTATYHEVDGLIDSFMYYVLESTKISYIKRVIAVAGDHVEIKDGDVFVNGEMLEEPYLDASVKTYIPEDGIVNDFIVPEGYIFAMGDNRAGSADCRAFGCVPVEKVEGRVAFRIWPLNKFGKIDN